MGADNLRNVEQKIIKALEKSPATPFTLMRIIEKSGTSNAVIREALWALTDKGEVRLDREQKLALAHDDAIHSQG